MEECNEFRHGKKWILKARATQQVAGILKSTLLDCSLETMVGRCKRALFQNLWHGVFDVAFCLNIACKQPSLFITYTEMRTSVKSFEKNALNRVWCVSGMAMRKRFGEPILSENNALRCFFVFKW